MKSFLDFLEDHPSPKKPQFAKTEAKRTEVPRQTAKPVHKPMMVEKKQISESLMKLNYSSGEGKEEEFSVTIPAGKYYLGDPCYSFSNDSDLWSKLLDTCDTFNHPIAEKDGQNILGFRTLHGNGEYQDNAGFTYGVDAGLIGLVPVEVADQNPNEIYGKNTVKVVNFNRDTECMRLANGTLKFGAIVIDMEVAEEVYDGNEEIDESKKVATKKPQTRKVISEWSTAKPERQEIAGEMTEEEKMKRICGLDKPVVSKPKINECGGIMQIDDVAPILNNIEDASRMNEAKAARPMTDAEKIKKICGF
jgi:hypothetical protein